MFSKEEFTKIIICSLFLGFIFSFNEWGYDTFNLAIGLKNLLISLIICLFLLLIQDGLKMYFGSKSYYILILSFVILSLTLDKVLGLFATLIISIILAFFIMLFSMNKLE